MYVRIVQNEDTGVIAPSDISCRDVPLPLMHPFLLPYNYRYILTVLTIDSCIKSIKHNI